VPLAVVDIDTSMKAKFSDLVADAGVLALQVFLMGHAMEKKHGALKSKCKDVVEDVVIWKYKVTSMETRLKKALKEEKEGSGLKEEKEVVEPERDSFKKNVGELEVELAAAKNVVEAGRGALVFYFDNGFKRATE